MGRNKENIIKAKKQRYKIKENNGCITYSYPNDWFKIFQKAKYSGGWFWTKVQKFFGF